MKLNIDAHVLMALAGMGSCTLGLPLEGALLFVLFHMAHALEAKFVNAAHMSITGLVDAVPTMANVAAMSEDGSVDWHSQKAMPVAEVTSGSLVVVKPGETIPLDGRVHDGQALVGVCLTFGAVKSMLLHLSRTRQCTFHLVIVS
jgi:Zn2+/Cd2+-exporting ATPase